ncbi:MAG: DUF6498-containing protein [bacterium]
MVESTVTKRSVFRDLSLWALLISNLITIAFALIEGWNILAVLWVYWLQSVSIGIISFIRILSLKWISTKGYKSNSPYEKATTSGVITFALFFLAHFGIFHLAYLSFISSGLELGTNVQKLPPYDFTFILISGGIFFLNHLFSYFRNKPKNNEIQNFGKIFIFPYIRIIPMHLTILTGAFLLQLNSSTPLILFFLILKTIVDLLTHMFEHNGIYKSEGVVPNEISN